MSQVKNTRLVIAQRRLQVSEFHLQGLSQTLIAERLNVSQMTVSGDLRAIKAEWRNTQIRNFEMLRAMELKKLELIEREAWAAWKRSQKPATTEPGRGTRTPKTDEERAGDPRFLDLVLKCIDQRCAMLGLDAPIEVVDTTPLLEESAERRRERLNEIFAKLTKNKKQRDLPAPELEPEQ